MTKTKPIVVVSNAIKAKIVRAFYDAAEKFIETAETHGPTSPEAKQVGRDIEALVAEAETLSSEEFSRTLSDAAAVFFARMPDANRDAVSQPDHSE